MQKLKIAIAVVIIAGAGLGVWLYYASPKNDGLTLYGNVDQRQVELAFIDAERSEAVLVQEGDEVRAGQVLARLETRRLRDAIAVAEARAAASEAALERLRNGTRPEEIDQARASVLSAEAEVAFSDAKYKRFDSLFRHSSGRAVSKQDVDEGLMQRNVARAQLNLEQKGLRLAEIGPRREDITEAEAVLLEQRRALEQLRKQLDGAGLKSPTHSIVNRRLMEPGDMASPQKAVFSLAVMSPKWVPPYVSGTEKGRAKPGMDAVVLTDSHPEHGIPGNVGLMSPGAEVPPNTVQTPAPDPSLRL